MWFEKQCMFYVFINFESNLIEVPNNNWWLDSGATTHVSHFMQGFLSIQTIKGSEKFLYKGNRMKTQIEGIGTYRLILNTGYHIDLKSYLYVPRCARNLVYVAKLDGFNFNFRIGNNVFSLFKNSYYYGFGILV